MKPKIGLLSVPPIEDALCGSILMAGGTPVLFPVCAGVEEVPAYLSLVDGLLVPGGEDLSPILYGEDPCAKVDLTRMDKDLFDLALIRGAIQQGKPVFGTCRGCQSINVALGGSLIQDIPTQVPGAIGHVQSLNCVTETLHTVRFSENSFLQDCIGGEELGVNTTHHQAVKELGKGLRVAATAPDGVIEAIQSEDGRVFAVQWHPEFLWKRYPAHGELFRRLVSLAAESL